VLLPDQPVPLPPVVVPVLPQNQAVLPVVIQHAVAAEHHAPSATAQARNTAETQQLTIGEDATAAEEHSLSSDDHQEEDPDAADNEQLCFDAEISGITGLDSQHGDGIDEYHWKWCCYVSEKEALMGASIIKGQGLNDAITWMTV